MTGRNTLGGAREAQAERLESMVKAMADMLQEVLDATGLHDHETAAAGDTFQVELHGDEVNRIRAILARVGGKRSAP